MCLPRPALTRAAGPLPDVPALAARCTRAIPWGMLPTLSARALFLTGTILLAVGVFIGTFLYPLLGLVVDLEAAASMGLFTTGIFAAGYIGAVIVPLGAVFVAVSFVARRLEPPVDLELNDPARSPRALSARQLLLIGCVLLIVGLVLQIKLENWLFAVRNETGLLLQGALQWIAVPLRQIALPLGAALIPCALLRLPQPARQPAAA